MKNYGITLLALFGAANAFTATLYDGADCTGTEQQVNVYDNTCKTDVNGFRSYKLTGGGAGGQYVRTWTQNACPQGGIPSSSCEGAASPGFSPGTCYDATAGGAGANAIGSSAVGC